MILGTHLVCALAKRHLDLPSDRAPVATDAAKLSRLGTLVAIRACNSQRSDACIAEREDNIAGRHFAHGFIERVALAVRLALGRPQVAARDLLGVGLILIDPPVPHRYCPARP